MFNGHSVTILDRVGKKMKSLGGKGGSGNVKFSSPRGVAMTPDKFILVSDNHCHRVVYLYVCAGFLCTYY